MEDTKLKFFAWNILTWTMLNSQVFENCDPESFDLENRNRIVREKVLSLCKENAIISLSEVDRTTWQKLFCLLAEEGYEGEVQGILFSLLTTFKHFCFKLFGFPLVRKRTISWEIFLLGKRVNSKL